MGDGPDTVIARLFDAASEVPLDERDAWLQEHCDETQRVRVEALLNLLDVHETHGDELFFALPGREEVPEALPERLGDYRVLDVIGRGGMGIVYRAVRADAPGDGGEELALKVLRTHVDSSHLRRRFLRESAVLERLRHPGICRFLDAGTDEQGGVPVPYLAMELVRGSHLLEHARLHDLSDRERVELLARVCDGVSHAHLAGVIHRDLKPSNVLVVPGGDEDRVGQPKVLDFGVARAAGDDLVTLTGTRTGALVGTIAYMSPEQVASDGKSVDERSDVYSLGVLLFELLTGRLPYRITGLQLAAAARVIQEEEPSRLGTTVERFRGPLEFVVGKALEKERDRRYPTAAAFAADLRRYLADGSVRARPPTLRRQVVKLARRHRTLAATLIGTFAALVLGLLTTLWFAFGQSAARQLADAEAERANRQLYRSELDAASTATSVGDAYAAYERLERAPPELRGWEWGFLESRIETADHVLELPFEVEEVLPDRLDLAFTADGRGLILVHRLQNASTRWARWDLASGERREGLLPQVAFLDEAGERVVTMAADGSLALVGLPSEERVRTLPLPDDVAPSLVEDPLRDPVAVDDGLLVTVGEDDVLLVDLESGGVSRRPRPPIWSGALTVDAARRLGTIAQDMEGFTVFDLDDPASAEVLHAGQYGTRRAALSPDGRRVAHPTSEGDFSQWSLEPGVPARLTHHLGSHEEKTYALAYSPDGSLLASAGLGRAVHVARSATGERLWSFSGHLEAILAIAFAPDGGRVASVAMDGTARVYSLESEDLHGVSHGAYMYAAGVDPSGSLWVTGSHDGGLRLLDMRTRRRIADLQLWDGHLPVQSLAFDPTRPQVAVASAAGRIVVVDLRTGATVADFESGLNRLAYGPDGRRLVLAGEWQDERTGTGILSWDPETHEVLAERPVTLAAAPDLSIDPQGRWVAVTHPEGAQLLDLATLETVAVLRCARDAWSLCFSPSGDQLAVNLEESVELWELPEQRRVGTFEHVVGALFDLAWSDDEQRLFTAERENAIGVWAIDHGERIAALGGHRDYVWSLHALPGGQGLVSASGDGTSRLWDTSSQADVAEARRERDRLVDELAPLVERLAELGPDEAAEALAANAGLDERARLVAAQMLLARRLATAEH